MSNITREDAVNWLTNLREDCGRYQDLWPYAEALEQIIKLLDADVSSVRHGHWIEEQDRIVCSECGARFKDEIIYMQENKPGAPHRCLECGAIMDQEVEE